MGWRRAGISAAGPLAELGLSVTLVALNPHDALSILCSPTGLVGVVMSRNAILGLLIPLRRNSDAAKIYRGLGQAIGVRRGSSQLSVMLVQEAG